MASFSNSDCFPDSDCGPYERATLDLVALTAVDWPDLPANAVAIAAPPWFAQRLSFETGERLTPAGGGMEVMRRPDSTVVGLPVLGDEPIGRFLAHDLLDGGCYELPLRCHPEVDPDGWLSLTLALAEGLDPMLAVAIATLQP